MQVIKNNVSREQLISQHIAKEERLNNGQSITKAIMMGAKCCCGAAYVE